MSQHLLTDDEAYELFRRAIVERSESAWYTIYEHYFPMLVHWAHVYNLQIGSIEFAEDIAASAFSRAWRALDSKQFNQFETLSSLLAYLRNCVKSVVLDTLRSSMQLARIVKRVEPPEPPSPEQQALRDNLRADFWAAIMRLGLSPIEQVLLSETLVHGLAPREILRRRPDIFQDIDQIYAIKRNLLARLGRSSDLRDLFNDLEE